MNLSHFNCQIPPLRLFLLRLLFYICTLNHFSISKIIEYNFNISYIVGSPDGVVKNILAVNGKFPGPTIVANVDDTLVVRVHNNIQDGQNTSIHWHGIRQKGSPFQDGTTMIAQCPLKAGHSQVYKFIVDEAGTYWWHAHAKSQYTEGLWGALIVKRNKSNGLYKYDDELIITLNDWNHRPSSQLESWFLSDASLGAPPFPDSALMNGVGRTNCSLVIAKTDYHCSPAAQSRPIFNVMAGRTYRIRIINASGYSSFRLSIDGHTMSAIEVDGFDVKESIKLDGCLFGPGQRYSFLVTMNAQADGHAKDYLIRANVVTEFFYLVGHNINQHHAQMLANVTGVLRYNFDKQNDGNTILNNMVSYEPFDYHQIIPPSVPSSTDKNSSSFRWLNEAFIEPHPDKLKNPPPDYFDQEFILDVTFINETVGSLNNIPFELPSDKPLIYKILRNESILYTKHHPLILKYMNVIQIVINNPYHPHPFHIHGHSFWVIGQGKVNDGNYDPIKHDHSLYSSKHIIQRDTIMVYENSWVLLRFIADNPGVWALHCHIDWHNLSGMTAVLIEGQEELIKNFRVPPETLNVCDVHNISL